MISKTACVFVFCFGLLVVWLRCLLMVGVVFWFGRLLVFCCCLFCGERRRIVSLIIKKKGDGENGR